jgi:hypothetical protein
LQGKQQLFNFLKCLQVTVFFTLLWLEMHSGLICWGSLLPYLTRSFDFWALHLQMVDDSGKPMSHTDGTGQISPDVAKLLPSSVLKGKVDNKEVHFLQSSCR